jgi:hypothetical protein
MKYAVEMGTGAKFRNSKVNGGTGGGGVHRKTDNMEIVYAYLHFFQNK